MSQLSPQKPPILPSRSQPIKFTQRPLAWLYALWKFSRPHTIIGTSLSVLALYLITWTGVSPLASGRGSWADLFLNAPAILPPLIACLCGNVYIVGLNQLEDVEIDRINKPHLPLASGEFSRLQGWSIVGIMGGLALALSALQSQALMATVWISLLIGTAYSLPPVRLKRFPVWASLCIFSVRGAIVNLGLFFHFRETLATGEAGGGILPSVWALTVFIIVFTFAIAIFKDIPDLEGDRRYQISTFTVRLGPKAVFNLARWVLTACYLGMILAGALIPGINTPFLVITHGAALLILWRLSFKVNLDSKPSIAQFYQFIWKLFFLEYLLFSIACLLG
ncbi:homogentisate phytyltransferase [Egbenema bharatensis]|uniref:homogentisate phytyltransferase n=1 Tax=Egbenema bharatensis TaxID=3463334 RepID=UPI003A89D6AE